jgi:predicted DNA-binding protein
MESETITVRVPLALKERLAKAMERDQRSMTNFVCLAIEERIRRVNSAPAVLDVDALAPPLSARRR